MSSLTFSNAKQLVILTMESVSCLHCRGAMIFTFFKAKGYSVGTSMVEDSQLGLAKQLVAKAAEKGVKLLLPTDLIVADKYAADAQTQVVPVDQIPEGWMVSCFRAKHCFHGVNPCT